MRMRQYKEPAGGVRGRCASRQAKAKRARGGRAGSRPDGGARTGPTLRRRAERAAGMTASRRPAAATGPGAYCAVIRSSEVS